MKKIISIPAFTFFLLPFLSMGQPVFELAIIYDAYNYSNAISKSNDGNYFIATSGHNLSGLNVGSLKKISSTGATQWEKDYFSYFTAIGQDMFQTQNGDIFFLSEESRLHMMDVVVRRYHEQGSLAWEKVFRYGEDSAAYFSRAFSIAPTDDDGAIFTGVKQSGSTMSQLAAYKISATGDSVWSKLYVDSLNASGYHIKRTPDGNYLIASGADWNNQNNAQACFVLKINDAGDILWLKAINNSWSFKGNSIAFTDEGNYLIFCTRYFSNTEFYPQIVAYSPSGDSLWSHIYTDLPATYSNSAAVRSDGSLVLLCNDSASIRIIYSGQQGNILWQKHYAQNYEVQNGNGLVMVTDKLFAFTGTVYNQGEFGDYQHAYIVADTIPDSPDFISENFISLPTFIYPNPATHSATLGFENSANVTFDLQVFDITGSVVMEQSAITSNRITLNTQHLAAGIYHYRLISEKEKKQSFGKFVVK
jgi:hypothetical protein